MPQRAEKAADRTLSFVKTEVERCRAENRAQLPTLQALAAAAGSSISTVARACRVLANQGVLESRRGSGIFVAGVPFATPSAQTLRPKRWRRVAEAIQRDIGKGVFLDSRHLPSAKELCGRYGVCPSTMRRALELLCSTGALVYRRRHYLPATAPRAVSAARVVLVARGWGRPKDYPLRHIERLRFFEWQCGVLGLTPHVVLMGYIDEKFVVLPGSAQLSGLGDEDRGTVGVVVWTEGCREEHLARSLAPLAARDVPVAVWERTDGISVSSLLAQRPAVFRSTGDLRAGADVGRRIAHDGHRVVAYVNPYGDTGWSAERLRGIRESGLGLAGSVLEWRSSTLNNSLVHIRKNQAAFGQARGEAVRSLAEQGDYAHERVGYALSKAMPELTREIHWDAVAQSTAALLAVSQQQCIDRKVSALVACNDEIARECVLQMASGAFPTLPVYSFDDSFVALNNRFSSYNFNDQGVIRALIAAVLYPSTWQGPQRRSGPTVIDGFITVRMIDN